MPQTREAEIEDPRDDVAACAGEPRAHPDTAPESKATAERTRAVVVGPYPTSRRAKKGGAGSRGETHRDVDARMEEAIGLSKAIDLEIVDRIVVALPEIRPSTYLGKGKVEEIAAAAKVHEATLVIMDCALSPVQQRNLEKAFGTKVIDRTGLILEIFGRRARTREGSLQVELAHLTYQKSRLVRSWTHLERQRGGFGFLGGPGETQIETDRRLIQERMVRIEHDLEGVKRTRALHRKKRRDVPYPIVALVGYTNAGKSTLFNRLTRATVLAEDMLFATLDPTLRALSLPHGGKVILSDTVGFISDLPTMLVSAFRATLEEVVAADVVLHVRDIAHEDTEAQGDDVVSILHELGVDAGDRHRVVEVWNKIDLLETDARASVLHAAERRNGAVVAVSAVHGDGIEGLEARIEALLSAAHTTLSLALDPVDGAGLAWLYEHVDVLDRADDVDGRIHLTIRVAPERLLRVERKFPAAVVELSARAAVAG